jgi:hypothetical protein
VKHESSALDRRLDDLGWGMFLVMTGTLWLMPAGSVPEGTWLVGTGVLLLGLNAIRRANDIPIHALTAILGVLALLAGLGTLVGVTLPLFAICLILVGGAIILRPFLSAHSSERRDEF